MFRISKKSIFREAGDSLESLASFMEIEKEALRAYRKCNFSDFATSRTEIDREQLL